MGQNKLMQCIQLLNNVETKGKQNMMNLLASLQILEQLAQEAQVNGMDCSNGDNCFGGPFPDIGETNNQSQQSNN